MAAATVSNHIPNLRSGGSFPKPHSGHAGTIRITIRVQPEQLERHETPDPLRSNAMKARIQCVLQTIRQASGRAYYWTDPGADRGPAYAQPLITGDYAGRCLSRFSASLPGGP
jgi:hypothetical protein